MSPAHRSLAPAPLPGHLPDPTTAVEARGVPASELPGPYPVGSYADKLRARLREFARVQVVGEVWGCRASRARVYFELRDSRGALPCSMWRSDFEALGESVTDGQRVVAGGGCDYYPGSSSSSPSFSFSVSELRIAGEGDLLAALARLRRQLAADGLFECQKRLARPALPRAIGVVTGEQGKARYDVLAGLARRGWAGRLVWAFAPVQDRHAAGHVTAALAELAALDEVEVVIVARGGGSLADLYAFCDEAMCRTVALLRVPVISSVGHHSDRTLLDDVAALACSTPTHAAEAAVPVDCRAARVQLGSLADRLQTQSSQAITTRARALGHLARAPRQHVTRQRTQLHQLLRELRASARRSQTGRRSHCMHQLQALQRSTDRAQGPLRAARGVELQRLGLALAAHDPARTLARGYAMVADRTGTPLSSVVHARAAGDVELRFQDGALAARVTGDATASTGDQNERKRRHERG